MIDCNSKRRQNLANRIAFIATTALAFLLLEIRSVNNFHTESLSAPELRSLETKQLEIPATGDASPQVLHQPNMVPTKQPTSSNSASSNSPAPVPPTPAPASPTPASTPTPTLEAVYIGKTDEKVQALPLDGGNIPINSQASLAEDILAIHHESKESKIAVTIKANAKCYRPFLIGRLSGPALVRLSKWTWINGTDWSVLEATYHAPVGGHYFLEVIAIFCDSFFYDFAQQAHANTETDWLSNTSAMSSLLKLDFKPICMLEPAHQRLTGDGAFIVVEEVPHEFSQPPNLGWSGIWWNQNASKAPLYTRYQPQNCYVAQQKKIPIPEDCIPFTSLDGLEEYSFQWDNNHHLDVSKLIQPNRTTICMVGCSHSRGLYEAGQSLGLNHTSTANIGIEHIPASYPNDATPKQINRRKVLIRPCDKLIIAVGQWPASFFGRRPTLLDEYYEAIRNMLLKLRKNSRTAVMEVYMRSIHYHSLGGIQSACPPTDWRSPPVIDAYNIVIERVCQELGVPFLDTRSISGPIWDGNPDWNHLAPKTNELELLYLLAAVLGITPNSTRIVAGA